MNLKFEVVNQYWMKIGDWHVPTSTNRLRKRPIHIKCLEEGADLKRLEFLEIKYKICPGCKLTFPEKIRKMARMYNEIVKPI